MVSTAGKLKAVDDYGIHAVIKLAAHVRPDKVLCAGYFAFFKVMDCKVGGLIALLISVATKGICRMVISNDESFFSKLYDPV